MFRVWFEDVELMVVLMEDEVDDDRDDDDCVLHTKTIVLLLCLL